MGRGGRGRGTAGKGSEGVIARKDEQVVACAQHSINKPSSGHRIGDACQCGWLHPHPLDRGLWVEARQWAKQVLGQCHC